MPQVAEPERVIQFRVTWMDDNHNLQARFEHASAFVLLAVFGGRLVGSRGLGRMLSTGLLLAGVEEVWRVLPRPGNKAGRAGRVDPLITACKKGRPCFARCVQVNRGFRVQFSSAIGPYKVRRADATEMPCISRPCRLRPG